MSLTKPHNIFVYGTLKRGFPNDHVGMPDADFLGATRTLTKFPLVLGRPWYTPYMIDEPGHGHAIEGELYRVDDKVLARLDDLESIHLPDGYHRRIVQIAPVATDGETITHAWTYLKRRIYIADIATDPAPAYTLDDAKRYVPPAQRTP